MSVLLVQNGAVVFSRRCNEEVCCNSAKQLPQVLLHATHSNRGETAARARPQRTLKTEKCDQKVIYNAHVHSPSPHPSSSVSVMYVSGSWSPAKGLSFLCVRHLRPPSHCPTSSYLLPASPFPPLRSILGLARHCSSAACLFIFQQCTFIACWKPVNATRFCFKLIVQQEIKFTQYFCDPRWSQSARRYLVCSLLL